MKITVITVCYNSESTIASCVQSVASQNYHNVEHLIVDGASIDRTLAIAGENLRSGGLIISEPDSGIYNAMNKGIFRATGDVIAFLNADDYYANSEVLNDVVDRFVDSGADAVFGDVAFFNPARPGVITRRYRSSSFKPSRLAWGVMPAHPGTFVRRALFDKVGGFREDYRIAADFEMAVRMFSGAREKLAFLDAVVVHMATGGVSTSGWRAALTINREVLRACRENGVYSNYAMIWTKYFRKLAELA